MSPARACFIRCYLPSVVVFLPPIVKYTRYTAGVDTPSERVRECKPLRELINQPFWAAPDQSITNRQTDMRIERIELRKILLPYVAPFETSGWREQGSHAIIVRMEAEGIVAWGESPVGENPFYNEENQKTAWSIMQDYLAPILLKTELASPWDVTPAFARVRGNRSSSKRHSIRSS